MRNLVAAHAVILLLLLGASSVGELDVCWHLIAPVNIPDALREPSSLFTLTT